MKRSDIALVLILAAGLAAWSPAGDDAPAADTGAATPAVAPFPAGDNVFPFTIGSLQAAALRDAAFSPANDNRTLAST